MTNAENELRRELRGLVVDRVRDDGDARLTIATKLAVPVESVDLLMKRPQWDMALVMRILDALEVAPRVVAL